MATTKSVRLPIKEYELLKKHAQKVGRTLAQVLARSIRNYCQ